MEKNVEEFMEKIIERNPGEKEFHQAVQEVAECVIPFIEKNPHYKKAKIIGKDPKMQQIYKLIEDIVYKWIVL